MSVVETLFYLFYSIAMCTIIFPPLSFFRRRKEKQTEMTNAPSGDRSRKRGIYNQREKRKIGENKCPGLT